jgi:NAD-dependent SIR2 family protein deacetylase
MHCISCNEELTDFELTRKNTAGEYLDLCNVCFNTIKEDVDANIRPDLMSEGDHLPDGLVIEDIRDLLDGDDYNE